MGIEFEGRGKVSTNFVEDILRYGKILVDKSFLESKMGKLSYVRIYIVKYDIEYYYIEKTDGRLSYFYFIYDYEEG